VIHTKKIFIYITLLSIFTIGCAIHCPTPQTNLAANELFLIKKNHKWGFIDREGKIVIEPEYEEASIFRENLAAVRINGKWGYINQFNKLVIKAEYDEVFDFNENISKVKFNNKWHFINEKGSIIYTYNSIMADYYAFGMTMPGREYTVGEGYKYGFNGKEKDNEGMGGGGSTYDYGFRIYNCS
jgi:hypothetical protein